ncbi:hypothetical protein [Gemmatimonas sp.]|uniref:hypothetical protein n=1 Tax=Gemmatimonas sp. TaxID=1962908 RepID=UPI003565F181
MTAANGPGDPRKRIYQLLGTGSAEHDYRYGKRRRRVRASEAQINDIFELLRWLTGALVVTDTSTAMSAAAYEGLRASVVSTAKDHRRLLVTLAELHDSLERGQSINTVKSKIEEAMAANGLVRTSDPTQEELYDLENQGSNADKIDVVEAAYVDDQSKSVIRLGRARWIPGPERITTSVGSGSTEETAMPTDEQDKISAASKPGEAETNDASADDNSDAGGSESR